MAITSWPVTIVKKRIDSQNKEGLMVVFDKSDFNYIIDTLENNPNTMNSNN